MGAILSNRPAGGGRLAAGMSRVSLSARPQHLRRTCIAAAPPLLPHPTAPTIVICCMGDQVIEVESKDLVHAMACELRHGNPVDTGRLASCTACHRWTLITYARPRNQRNKGSTCRSTRVMLQQLSRRLGSCLSNGERGTVGHSGNEDITVWYCKS